MEVIEKIKSIVADLNELEEYASNLGNKLSEADSKTQDLLHYVEDNKLNIVWCYRYMKELKKIRLERRKIKNDIEIMTKYNENKTKLLSNLDNRNMLLSEIFKREKQLNIPYKNRQYTEEEMAGILKGKE